ncbi:MAG: DUF1349 domain-containing protein [Spirochaetes bacterium]|nr:DUF1349 domain-containing protein [Spirochaetota bacterium]
MAYELMNTAAKLDVSGDDIVIEASAGSDFFIDGGTGVAKTNAPFYHREVQGDFVLRCRVQPLFLETYDAGCICAYESPDRWIKLAFERTDLGYESVVTVVTDSTSDDCNGERIEGESLWLQIVRKDNMWCLHHSSNGRDWKMSRYFFMEMEKQIRIGLVAQSPVGKGCVVHFWNPAVEKEIYGDIRSAR